MDKRVHDRAAMRVPGETIEDTPEPIGKLEAARRQLDTGIEMMFLEMDPLPTHSVLFAANSVLRDLCKAKGVTTKLDEAEKDWIKPEHEKEYQRFVRHRGEFLKHAQKDPEGSLAPFSNELNSVTALKAIFRYGELAGKFTCTMQAFLRWFTAVHPVVLKNLEPLDEALASTMKLLGADGQWILGRVIWAMLAKPHKLAKYVNQLQGYSPKAFAEFSQNLEALVPKSDMGTRS
jgi:hypothetical protein